jgi:hypothetical protein
LITKWGGAGMSGGKTMQASFEACSKGAFLDNLILARD